jgi:arginyl-tRNA synthetase
LKQLINSQLVTVLSIYTGSNKTVSIGNKKIPLYKDRNNSKLVYVSSLALGLSKSQNQKAMETASAIAFHLLAIAGGVFDVKIVSPGLIHLQVNDQTLAAWLQSLVFGSIKVREKIGRTRDKKKFPVSDSLFAAQHAHARCCSLILLAHREGLIKLIEPVPDTSLRFWNVNSSNPIPWLNSDQTLRLTHPDEYQLIAELVQVIDNAECPDFKGYVNWEKVALDLSKAFENFWSSCRIWGEVKIFSQKLAQARLGLLMATQSVLRFLLEEKLGIFAPLEL